MEEKTYKNDKVLSVEELQDVLKIGRNTTLKLIKTDGFPTIKIGKRILVPVAGLDAWLIQNTGKNIEIQ